MIAKLAAREYIDVVKKSAIFLLALSAMAFAGAQTAVVVRPVTTSATVVSPLADSTAKSNQALLSQMNATISEHRFEPETLTINGIQGGSVNSDRWVAIGRNGSKGILTTPGTTGLVIPAEPQIIHAK